MRIKEPFAESRKSETIEYRKKYFIASEGSSSEPRYFDGLNENVISENIKIINILRDYTNLGRSHPTQLTDLLRDFLENKDEKYITVKELKNKISNWGHENNNRIDISSAIKYMEDEYPKEDYKIKYDLLEDLFMKLFKLDIYKDLSKHFALYFQAQDVTYSEETDSLNMVIDRDKDSFFDDQYEKVLDFCNKNSVDLYVSNPNFEFWLLLHFDEVNKLDKVKLLDNPKTGGKRRYTEKCLHHICKYKKSKLNFRDFEPYIHDAIERAKMFEINLNNLRDNIGSNVGQLVEKIIMNKKS